MYQTNCYVSLQVIFEWFLGQCIPHRYGHHCALLRELRAVRSLSCDYAALLSSCPGVRHQTVVIDIHYSETFGLKIFYKFSLEHTGGTLQGLYYASWTFPGQLTEIVNLWLLMLRNCKFQKSFELYLFIFQRPNVSPKYWNIQLSISTCAHMTSVPTKYFSDKDQLFQWQNIFFKHHCALFVL